MIYQVHPEHGRHFAQSLIEAEANEKNGWRTVTEDEFYGAKKEDKKACPKCGKELKRGLTMHIRHCK